MSAFVIYANVYWGNGHGKRRWDDLGFIIVPCRVFAHNFHRDTQPHFSTE